MPLLVKKLEGSAGADTLTGGAAASEEAGWIESFQQHTMIPEGSNGQERDRIHCSNGLRIDPQTVQESTVHRVSSSMELK